MQNLSDKDKRLEIRIAGSGGQGVILAGIILAEAAVLEGNYAAQSQAYGPEARGGSSRTDVILSDMEIDYCWNLGVDILVALTQQGYDQNSPDLKEDGLVIVDPEVVHRVLHSRAVGIPLRQIACGSGEERSINMAALGALATFCPLASCGSLANIMAKRLPPSRVEGNMFAFRNAMEFARCMKLTLRGHREPVEI
ncbi:MAG: 2-oxoacid:acceptor oxidoreductase family protein [Dehalococcoidia bacterium]